MNLGSSGDPMMVCALVLKANDNWRTAIRECSLIAGGSCGGYGDFDGVRNLTGRDVNGLAVLDGQFHACGEDQTGSCDVSGAGD
jgi:hypothetical protein